MEQKDQTLTHKLGDVVERAGEKVSDMGAPKTGNKISNAGDRLEHSRDEKIERTEKV